MELFPFADGEKTSFKSPSATTYDAYLTHIESELVGDTPLAFGLHPNAEIGFRTDQSETMFGTLLELQPRESGSGADVASPQKVAEGVMQDIIDRFADIKYELDELGGGEEKGPFQNVLSLECEQMNKLLFEVNRSLIELGMGFAGELTMSDSMDDLMNSLFLNRVPKSWARLAWPSLRSLQSWLHDWSSRISQLNEWAANPLEVPKVRVALV
jgi:dynein heavy chain